MDVEPLLLARIQFAFALGYHIIFPSLSIGLAWYLGVLRTWEFASGNPKVRAAFDYWLKVFALTFGMGVITGVTLSYAIGTTFGGFSENVGSVVGPLMSYEVLTAFFLEAGFLGIMLFGRSRVSPVLHLAATWLVAVGTLLSAFWILSANSWMHTPAGYKIVDGAIEPDNWLEIIFNPSFPYRFAHMMLAAMISSAFVIAAIAAWYLRKNRHVAFASLTLRNAILTTSLLMPLQIFVGDLHGLNTLEHQPMKVAAMEGLWETSTNVPLLLIAIPDQQKAENTFEIGIPNITSLILTHSLDGEVKGLKEVAPEDRPPVWPVFYAFRVMVGCGMIMLLLAWSGAFLAIRGKLESATLYLKALTWSAPLGFIALLAGWITTEIGRQPWTVHGLLRTQDAVSNVSAGKLWLTMFSFGTVYSILFVCFMWFLFYLIRKGPKREDVQVDEGPDDGEKTIFRSGASLP